MRIKSIHLENFGSYKTLDLEFGNGLTLIQGPNGAGKSTIFDAMPWILFGKTSKGGKADEIRSWNGGATNGTAIVADGSSITRSRAPNDCYILDNSILQRGKDLVDTQRRIDERLGFNWDSYQRGAYFHEFSETAQFFTASAKYRRDLCESITDLTLALKLQSKASDKVKDIESAIHKVNTSIYSEEQRISTFLRLTDTESKKVIEWGKENERAIRQTEESESRFEKNRKQTVTNQCSRCGTTLKAAIEVYDDSPNPYAERLRELRDAVCPYDGTVRDFQTEIDTAKGNITSLRRRLGELNQDKIDTESLLDILKDFRGAVVKNTIDYITNKTNSLLTEYFDGELSLTLEIEGADKLDITIHKDGNVATFTQLSKGQRQLLKLCFSVAVMEAISNHRGVKFEQLFFDESLDGLSDMMKTKAFRLFEMLSTNHEDVFVIDHSEALKVLFPNIITISNEDGNSVINAGT